MTARPTNIITPVPPALDALRRDLDWIDDQILDLLEQRYAVVKRIAWSKRPATDHSLAIRPGREAAILDRLRDRAIHVPAADVTHLWRSIFILSAYHQRAFRVLVTGPASARHALLTVAARRFGSAVSAEWIEEPQIAWEAAAAGEAILIVPADEKSPAGIAGLGLIGQHPTGCVDHPWALELGRISTEDGSLDAWSPASWRRKIHQQLPAYADARLVGQVERQLAERRPVVPLVEVTELRASIAAAQQGRGLLLQAGDCAERIDAGVDSVTAMAALIDALGSQLEEGTKLPTIRLGRMGGQFGKPRSRTTEATGLAAYRGDAVNGREPCGRQRAPDPRRLLLARDQARRVHDWIEGGGRAPLYTSHEALLLPYEDALTHVSAGQAWASSAHSLWLGDRTRQIDGAHVEYLRGIANPIGIKCGPTMSPEQLLALLRRIDPVSTPGRVMLVARLGRARVAQQLPSLMIAVKSAGHDVLWVCDPMHGNNRSANGTKVRLVPEIIAETRAFVRCAAAAGVHPGGLHLEVTPADVLECVEDLEQATADRPYESLCDPRLNAEQAARVVAAFVDELEHQP